MATGTHLGGRPTTHETGTRELGEAALFEIGEGRIILADVLTLSRQLEEAQKAATANIEAARQLLDLALKNETQVRVINENVKRFASIRLTELRVEEKHLREVADSIGIHIDPKPVLEVVRT